MKMLFLGAGYCTEFLTPLIQNKFEIIGVHNQVPFKIKYLNFECVKRYAFQQFLNDKNSILQNVTHILNSIPPNDYGDIPFHHIKKELINLRLKSEDPNIWNNSDAIKVFKKIKFIEFNLNDLQ